MTPTPLTMTNADMRRLVRRARGAFRRLDLDTLDTFALIGVTEAAAHLLDALEDAEWRAAMRGGGER